MRTRNIKYIVKKDKTFLKQYQVHKTTIILCESQDSEMSLFLKTAETNTFSKLKESFANGKFYLLSLTLLKFLCKFFSV